MSIQVTSETRLTIMSYNVLGGGLGAEPALAATYDWYRLDEILDFISDERPDILVVQEAFKWDVFMEDIVSSLEMPFHEHDEGGMLAIFSRYEIIEVEAWSHPFTNGVMRAAIRLPDGDTLHVFNAHLTPDLAESIGGSSDGLRLHETLRLIGLMEPYSNELVILAGDLNFSAVKMLQCVRLGNACRGPFAERAEPGKALLRADWDLVAYEDCSFGLEQVWVPSALRPIVQELQLGTESETLARLSDHLPIEIELAIE